MITYKTSLQPQKINVSKYGSAWFYYLVQDFFLNYISENFNSKYWCECKVFCRQFELVPEIIITSSNHLLISELQTRVLDLEKLLLNYLTNSKMTFAYKSIKISLRCR